MNNAFNYLCEVSKSREMYYRCEAEKLKQYFHLDKDEKPKTKTIINTIIYKINK